MLKMQHYTDTELLRLYPTLLNRPHHTGWLIQAQDEGRPSEYLKVAALLFIIPAYYLMYRHMCHGNNNKLKIHLKGMATFKK